MRIIHQGLMVVFLLLMSVLAFPAVAAEKVVVVPITGGIGPGVLHFVKRAISQADRRGVEAIVLRIDTPGGLSQSMRGIIKRVLTSNTPVIGYVSPRGARAASAGAYILAATNIAAMAPGTNLGAATPVAMGMPTPDKKEKKSSSAMTKKAMEDAQAYMRTLAQMRGRNVYWLEKMVTKGASLSAKEALKKRVIDYISPNLPALLRQVNGQTVQTPSGKRQLQTAGAQIEQIKPGAQDRFLQVLSNPALAYILLMIGIYGLLLEFFHPGMIVPGVVGAIALLLGLYSMQMLPIDYTGVALLVLGIALVVVELFTPTFGILGVAGVISFVFGSIFLFKPGVAGGVAIPWGVIVPVTLVTIVFVFFVLGTALKARRRRVVSGAKGMIGEVGVVESNGEWVKVMGERWRFTSHSSSIKPGSSVRVLAIRDLVLQVEPVDESIEEKKA